MKCDKCEQDATVHEVLRRGGKTVEHHLCEQCARKQGIAVQQVPISELIQKYVLSQTAERNPATARACPSCETRYAEFKTSGLLGCPDCYAAFESSLGPLLERTHEGGTHHVGKTPRRTPAAPAAPAARPARTPPMASAPPPAPAATPVAAPPAPRPESPAQRIAILKRQLDQAVKAEQYEKAAALRDQIRTLGQAAGPGAGA